ncbi:MAG: polyribonucleotide nucleotidyltransferase [Bacilli bacterium]
MITKVKSFMLWRIFQDLPLVINFLSSFFSGFYSLFFSMPTTKRAVHEYQSSFERNGKKLSFAAGKLAVQADASVTLGFEDTRVLFSTVMSKEAKSDADFLPLMVEMRESFAAAGRIGGAAYRRREGRPSDQAILNARLTDRAIRPMFPKGMVNDIVITVTPMAMDPRYPLGVVSIVGSSISIMAAGIPFEGPVGAAQIAYVNGEYIVNPTNEQLEVATLNLVVAGKKGSINMIETEANEVSDEVLKKAFEIGQAEIDRSCDFQSEFLAQLTITPKEVTFNKPSATLEEAVKSYLGSEKLESLMGNAKVSFNEGFSAFEKELLEAFKEQIADETNVEYSVSKVKMAFFNVTKYHIRNRTLDLGKRVDDRTKLDIRPLYCEVGLFERTHGTGLFWRGDTQVLSTVTLGGPTEYLILDDMENDDIQQRYFHHYNFPPFSVGEARGIRGVGRREIGHGRLAEKALEKMIPTKEEFPYTIRVVSECLGSGGSTSMGSVCGSTLSLMDAGVPIKKPVAGIAMGLFTEHDEAGTITKYAVLNDLMGTEDFIGDMDFKVAGTRDGITAIQLDTKLKGIPLSIVFETIDQANAGYREIMEVMLETLPAPRAQVGRYAPKIHVFTVDPAKIKEVIGKGGDVINKIIEDCDNIKIDFEDDGTCYLTHADLHIIDKAKAIIMEIVTDLEV